MYGVVAEEEQVKFVLDAGVRRDMIAAFEEQGVNVKVGLTRLVEFFLRHRDMRPLLLNQLTDVAAEDLARGVLKRGGGKRMGLAAKSRRDEL